MTNQKIHANFYEIVQKRLKKFSGQKKIQKMRILEKKQTEKI